ncbi:uncharacterized protein LOC118200626, partial [Stegodyphus dumicola]|uniref:uncharacterized protein LOC118200626 n=1 Tax=Stegodyphus dumicola TaxID=202533 RepID=UPI0015AFC7E0
FPLSDDSDSEYNIIDDNPSYTCPKRHGRFTHEEICNWYYHCKDNTPSVRFCHSSQYYDSIRNICYNNVDCGRRKPKEDDKTITPRIREFVCPSKNGKFTHPKNCGAFYVCKKYKYKLHHCPEGKLFDRKWQSCEPEQEVTCGERIHPALDPDEPQDKEVDPNPTFTCIENHGRFEHDDYCDWYYNCHDKKASLRECRRGKYYDKKKRKCIHSRDVFCENRKQPEDRDITAISSTTEQVVSTTQESVFECPKKEGKFAHERDCSMFYHCKKGKHTIHRCPKNRLFDEERRSCEDEERVSCGHRIHPDMDPDEVQDEIIDPNPSFRCKSNHGRFTHDEYCYWYYHCHDKKASIRQCRKGKYYDTRRKKCYDAKDVSCEGRRKPDDMDVTTEFITIEVSTTETPEFQCPRKEGKFAHERDCGKFYDCKRGEYKIHKCPKNKLFDEERRSCEDDDHVSCGQRIHPDMDPDEPQDEIIDPIPNFRCKHNHGRFTHEEYCHWYYHCHDNKASIRQCKNGKYYNSKRKKCYDPKDVSCEGRRKPDDVDMTTEFITTEVSTTDTPEFQCPRKEGKFAHERDCGKFYDCKRGEYKIHKCPKNKLFDEERRSCEDDDHVSCGKRIHPDMDPDEPQDEIVDPNPNFRCKHNHGKFTHEEYCHWYYHCHDNNASVRQCKKGKYYDTRRRKCYHSKDVSCEGRRKPDEVDITTEFITREVSTTEAPKFQCPRKDGKFAHEKDCGKFYDCKRGEYKIHKCPKNKLFDEKQRHCEDEDDVSCGQRIHPDMDPDEPQDKIVDPNPDFRCKSKHRKYIHEEFCHLYYKCHDKKASIRECRSGKYYDIKKKKCVNSKDVSCGKRKEPEEISTIQPKPETTTITFPETEETSEISIITSPPSTTSEQPETTSTFPETKTVSEASNITRLPSTISEQPATTSTFPETKTVSEASSITRLPSTISEQPTTISTFPETDTTLRIFNITSSSVTVTEVPSTTTPPRTITEEPATSSFVSITNELTTNPPVTTTEETAASSMVTAAEKPITTGHPITTTETSMTKLNLTTADVSLTTIPQMISTSSRPIPSEHPRTAKSQATVSAHTTVYEESSTSPPSVTISELQSTTQLPTDDGVNPDKIVNPNPKYDCNGDEGNFPHEKYCHYYFSCKNNKATLRECPEGTYFDMMRGQCEEWYMVSCGDRLTREDVDSTSDDFESTPFIPERRTISYPDLKSSREPVSEKPSFECPTEEGFYEHEKNCEKYYICKNKVPEVKTCSEGQLYDTEKRACNDEQETNCGERIHPMDDPDNPDKIPDKVIDPNPDFNCTHRHGCFTHELFCKWYYYCHDNRPEVRECAGDQYFDSKRNKCLDWWMVICDKRIVPEETTLFPITDATKDQGTTSYENKKTGSTDENNNIGTDFTHNWSREFSITESDEKTGMTSTDAKWTGSDKWTTMDWSKRTRQTDQSVETDSGRWTTTDWSKSSRSTNRNGGTDSGRWTTRNWSKGPWSTDRSGG